MAEGKCEWALALAVTAMAALLSCTSTAPTTPVQPVPPATDGDKVAVTAQQQPVKPQHECVGNSELSQYYVVDRARLEGDPNAHLNYCFVSGYRGIGCPDDWNSTHALGHALSNRERAGCDAIMRRMERREAAEESRKKRLDEAYDKQHGLKPAQ